MRGTLYTGGTTSPGPVISADGITLPDPDGYYYNIELSQYSNIPCENGVFTGSLSSHGNMIAMALGTGSYKVAYAGRDPETNADVYYKVPWLTGCIREYWKDPIGCTFGSNSAIPAITGVMPDGVGVQGNALYYLDLQMTRITGSNYFDNFKFISTFNQALTWVTSSNDYIVGLKKAESNSLSYYGDKTYQEFLTSGFSNYKIGTALRLALTNSGSMIKEVAKGHFGTPNSVAKALIEAGLGAYGNLTAKLAAEGIPINDNIYNDTYTANIEQILKTITRTADLKVIQEVIGSKIPSMTNPTDYTSIEKCSGISNDSVFASFKEFGKDLHQRSPNFSIPTGLGLASVIDYILADTAPGVEQLATTTGILPPDIIAGLRTYLPEGPDNGPVNLLNVIGTPSGYLLGQLDAVNQGLDQLNKSSYGPQLRAALTKISTDYIAYYNAARDAAASGGPDYGPTIPVPSPDAYNKSVAAYYALLNTIANDPQFASVVKSINDNYLDMCKLLAIEVKNFNKGAVKSNLSYNDVNLIYSFVNSLPTYAADTQGLGTSYFLYGLCQNNQAGDIVRSIMDQFKNNQVLNLAGVRILNKV